MRRKLRTASFISLALVWVQSLSGLLVPSAASAQEVSDKSDAVIGKADARTVLDLINTNISESEGAKVTELRRSKGAIVCGSVNVKNKEGRYLGERGFIADLSKASFDRLPEGPEFANPKSAGFAEKEAVRALYFEMCMD